MRVNTVKDIDIRDKRVLMRVDYNVPLDRDTGAVTDDTRLRATIPTIRYLQEQGAKIILCSHLGRPDGMVVDRLRLGPIAERLSDLLGQPVKQLPDCIGARVAQAVRAVGASEIVLLENLRFHPEEEANDPEFARELASLADIYVNDAFGTAHRAHASTAGVAAYLPAVAGFLMDKEVSVMGTALERPNRPFAAVIGGAKISSKIAVLDNLMSKVEVLVIGGGMANTFLKAQGYDIGSSLVEEDQVEYAKELLHKAWEKGVKRLLPMDVVIADKIDKDANVRTVPVNDIPSGWSIVDIGPDTVEEFASQLRSCLTIIWNGPMGIFEIPAFANGSIELATVISEISGVTIVGGGETVALVTEMGLEDKFTHVSTGGGASLEFLEGKELPGVAALMKK
ncbi:MAG: phosphoglycerate kinase [Dehalococcoidia bacterium]|nr:phosphoglycerate kinase [Dehalococcoidia bacterium]